MLLPLLFALFSCLPQRCHFSITPPSLSIALLLPKLVKEPEHHKHEHLHYAKMAGQRSNL
jgi:hypothetical protein